MPLIYMDNAATSFPKPPAVFDAMSRHWHELMSAPSRGLHAPARESKHLVDQCRARINRLINGQSPEHVIFTLNASDALNLGIKAIVKPQRGSDAPDHIITTWMEHNSVLRPCNALAEQWGVEVTRVPCDPKTGLLDPDDIRKAIRPNTRLIAIVHGSNVGGTLQPIHAVGKIAREHDIPFLVDAAQSLGHTPIDVQRDNIDLLAFPGHKGLLGPLGTGALYIRPGIEKRMHTVREGGTGSVSEHDVQPDFMPDRFEPGSHNTVGIIGLSEGVQWLLDQTLEKIWQHEQDLCRVMIDGLSDTGEMPGLSYLGPQGIANRCGVFSIRIDGFDRPQALSDILEKEYSILTRSGLVCAPLAHKTFGTHTLGGATRFSFGPFLSKQDVKYACDALGQICHQHATATR